VRADAGTSNSTRRSSRKASAYTKKFLLNAKASGRESGHVKETYPDRGHHRPERTTWMIRFAELGVEGTRALV
jgi:hypothetical protein